MDDIYLALLRCAARERAVNGSIGFNTRRALNEYNDTASWEADLNYIEEGITNV